MNSFDIIQIFSWKPKFIGFTKYQTLWSVTYNEIGCINLLTIHVFEENVNCLSLCLFTSVTTCVPKIIVVMYLYLPYFDFYYLCRLFQNNRSFVHDAQFLWKSIVTYLIFFPLTVWIFLHLLCKNYQDIQISERKVKKWSCTGTRILPPMIFKRKSHIHVPILSLNCVEKSKKWLFCLKCMQSLSVFHAKNTDIINVRVCNE